MTPFDYIILVLALVMVYAWCIFPPVLSLIARTKSCHKVSADTAVPGEVPRVAVLIAAHNEEAVIRQRLENLFELSYPVERMQILIGVDGSSDTTASVAREFAAVHEAVKVIEYKENRGKIAVLKDLVDLCVGGREGGGESTPNAQRPTSNAQHSGSPTHEEGSDEVPELLVFTDANTHFRRDALKRLVSHFRDPGVGGVCGRLVFTSVDPHSVPEVDMANPSSEGFYWDWETRIKESESRLDSCLGANGGIYAIRPELFWSEIPDNTIVDDFVIGMKVREQGARVVYDSAAVAYEELPEISHEWGRRVRIGAGAYQSLCFCRKCLLPVHGWFSWCFWSHKVLRWLSPHMLGIVVLLSVLQLCGLENSAAVPVMGRATAAGALATLLLALAGVTAKKSRETSGLFRLTAHFVTMQLALLVGFFRFCRGNLKGRWRRTER